MKDKIKSGNKSIKKNKTFGLRSAKDLMKQFDILEDTKYVTKEFQDYGYRLAVQLNDLKHKSLYIKLAKERSRHDIEKALRFAKDYPKARNKAKIFMWKLKELGDAKKDEKTKKKINLPD